MLEVVDRLQGELVTIEGRGAALRAELDRLDRRASAIAAAVARVEAVLTEAAALLDGEDPAPGDLHPTPPGDPPLAFRDDLEEPPAALQEGRDLQASLTPTARPVRRAPGRPSPPFLRHCRTG